MSPMPLPPGLDFAQLLRPVPRTAVFAMDDWFVWCGTVARTDDGLYHLLFSRWPAAAGHRAWVTHSEVGYAAGESPLGPFEFQHVALAGSGRPTFDRDVIHNPTILRVGARWYLYYTGNFGNGEYWDHRNHQRVGVAVADHPAGPWERFPTPLLEVRPGRFDHLITTNPSATIMPDGRILLMYKTVGEGEPPFGGKVTHGVAFAEDPLGPFERLPHPVLEHPTEAFPLEDPYVWYGPDRFYAILKDFKGVYTGAGPSLALFESADGLAWEPSTHVLVCPTEIRWADGETQRVTNLERPQVLIENGVPSVLYCACSPDGWQTPTFNVHLPLARIDRRG